MGFCSSRKDIVKHEVVSAPRVSCRALYAVWVPSSNPYTKNPDWSEPEVLRLPAGDVARPLVSFGYQVLSSGDINPAIVTQGVVFVKVTAVAAGVVVVWVLAE